MEGRSQKVLILDTQYSRALPASLRFDDRLLADAGQDDPVVVRQELDGGVVEVVAGAVLDGPALSGIPDQDELDAGDVEPVVGHHDHDAGEPDHIGIAPIVLWAQ